MSLGVGCLDLGPNPGQKPVGRLPRVFTATTRPFFYYLFLFRVTLIEFFFVICEIFAVRPTAPLPFEP